MEPTPIYANREKYIKSVVELTNNCGLPAMVVEYVLRDILMEVHNEATRQAQEEKDKLTNKD